MVPFLILDIPPPPPPSEKLDPPHGININLLLKSGQQCGRKEMFYLTTHPTHFIYGYMGSDIMVEDHSDRKRGNPLPPHRLLFSISSKGSFICIIPQT